MKKTEVKIIEAFAVIIVCSFLPEFFPDLFGDWTCTGSGKWVGGGYHFERCNYLDNDNGFHDATTHWGFRHWTLLTMGVVLFINKIRSINIS